MRNRRIFVDGGDGDVIVLRINCCQLKSDLYHKSSGSKPDAVSIPVTMIRKLLLLATIDCIVTETAQCHGGRPL